jgi:hypothetical protein
MSIELAPISQMPAEIMHQIFSGLDERSLGRCTGVSRDWNRVASDDRLWKQLFPGIGAPDKGVKAYIDSHSVKSFDEIVDRLQGLANKLSSREGVQFRCVFPFNPKCRVTAKNYSLIYAYPVKQEICIFLRAFPVALHEITSYSISFGGSTVSRFKVVFPGDWNANESKTERLRRVLENREQQLIVQERRFRKLKNAAPYVVAAASIALCVLFHIVSSSKEGD